jgi:hypothetical protein
MSRVLPGCGSAAGRSVSAGHSEWLIFDISREGLDLDMETRVSALERAVAETKKTSSDRL